MASAIQTPLRHREGTQLGGRVFRKQVLPYATVEKGGRRITFDRDYCARLVDAFKGRAFPQVPFVLVDPRTNEHVEDPERYRGEVKGLELSGDGLDAVLELSEAGARLVEANPRLGVSVRIVEDQERADGRRIPLAIKHVAGTLDPEIGSLGEWERLSDLSADYGQSGVVDMTSATYPDEMPETPIFTDEEAKALLALLAERGGTDAADPSTTTTPEAKPAKSPQEREQEIAAEMAALYAEHPELASESEKPEAKPEATAGEREPAGVALSAESQRKLDLAAEQAKRASDEAADLRRQLAEKDFEAERRSYVLAGVPKAAVDLAAPALKHQGTIDLSHGEKAEPGKIVRGLLDLLRGTIDLSGAQGSESPDPDGGDAARTEHERLAKLYAEKFGEAPRAAA